MRLKRPPQVEVEWIDACDRDFSGTLAEALARGTLVRRFQSGYLIHRGKNSRDEDVLILAQTVDPPESDRDELAVDRLTIIPSAWVKSVKYKDRRRRATRQEGVQGGGGESAADSQ